LALALALLPRLLGQSPVATVCTPQFSGELAAQFVESSYRVAPGGLSGTFRTGQPAGMMLSGFGFDRSGGPLMFRYNSGIATDGVHLLLADRGNNRVLVWNQIPESNTPPDFVLGQPDFESNDSGSGRHQMNWPISVAADGRRIVVADTYNDRLLIWNSFPTASGAPADLEIRIVWPWGVWMDGERLVATSTGGGAALIWNRFPTRDHQPPDLRLRANGMFGTPRTITSNGRTLIVGDHNSRVTRLGQGNFVWKAFPQAEDAPFDFFFSDPLDEASAWLQGEFFPDGRLALLGRTLHLWNAAPEGAGDPPSLSVRGFQFRGGDGSGIALAGERMFISGANGNRVLVYNAAPQRAEQAPDWALGSPEICTNTLETNFFITNPAPSSNGVSLFVSSDFDRKLYVWRKLPDDSGARPDIVYQLPEGPWQNALWQNHLLLAGKRSLYLWTELPLDGRLPSLTFRDGIGSVRFQELRGVSYDGRYLYLSDMPANRVYVWEGIPSRDSEPTAVLEVDRPTRLSSDGTWLLVTTTENQAIRVFRVEELAANPAPRTVGGPGRFNLPEHAIVAHGRLFVADTVFNRVHCWNRIQDALAGGEPDAILGSADRRPQTTREGLFWPGGLSFDGAYLWVGEYKFSGRLLRYSLRELVEDLNSGRTVLRKASLPEAPHPTRPAAQAHGSERAQRKPMSSRRWSP